MLFKDGPVALREGEQLVGTFDCRKHAENPRGLSMMIEYRVKGQNCDDDVRRESYNLA